MRNSVGEARRTPCDTAAHWPIERVPRRVRNNHRSPKLCWSCYKRMPAQIQLDLRRDRMLRGTARRGLGQIAQEVRDDGG